MTDEQGADPSLDRSALYYQILGLEPGASPGEVSRAYGERLKQWNPEGLPESSELRQEAEKKLQSVQVAFRRIRATWPESVQQIV
ncbi:MAG: J domain-containing protein, partial [Gemmatimonadota bacterium]